jgi:hypothetical protein
LTSPVMPWSEKWREHPCSRDSRTQTEPRPRTRKSPATPMSLARQDDRSNRMRSIHSRPTSLRRGESRLYASWTTEQQSGQVAEQSGGDSVKWGLKAHASGVPCEFNDPQSAEHDFASRTAKERVAFDGSFCPTPPIRKFERLPRTRSRALSGSEARTYSRGTIFNTGSSVVELDCTSLARQLASFAPRNSPTAPH